MSVFLFSQMEITRKTCVPYGDILVKVGGDIADKASHKNQDNTAAPIQRHHHTHLSHTPVHWLCSESDHLSLIVLLLAFQLYLWLFLQSPCRENDTKKVDFNFYAAKVFLFKMRLVADR